MCSVDVGDVQDVEAKIVCDCADVVVEVVVVVSVDDTVDVVSEPDSDITFDNTVYFWHEVRGWYLKKNDQDG